MSSSLLFDEFKRICLLVAVYPAACSISITSSNIDTFQTFLMHHRLGLNY